jgi:hypothetical protein
VAVNLAAKAAVEAIQGIWGERRYPQRSLLTEARARAVAALEAWHLELHKRPQGCQIPELRELSEFLASSYLGYGAHEHELLIRAMQASSSTSTVNVAQPGGRDDA